MQLMQELHWFARRCRRGLQLSKLSFLVYRYRYLAAFTAIGFVSIALEVLLARYVLPARWPWLPKACLAFSLGLTCSFLLNALLNFRVPAHAFVQTFAKFSLVSSLSFGLNMLAVYSAQAWLGQAYGMARFASAGVLFFLAYSLHRRFTFDATRNFGIAVYATRSERLHAVYSKIGRKCDHVHVDLVDESFDAHCLPVAVNRVRLARRIWKDTPLFLHIMSRHPAHWMEQTWDDVDCYLFHTTIDDDPLRLIVECRLRRKQVGVVWHCSAPLETVLPLLPHVDFVMVLGIAKPGQSGQALMEEAIAVTNALDDMRKSYGYTVVFDGGVNPNTVSQIRAKYIVAASSVLRAENPVLQIHQLKTEARYGRSAA